MKRASVILAGGLSTRLGQDKCLRKLTGRPLIAHVLDRVAFLSDERIIVVSSEAQRSQLSNEADLRARIVVDKYSGHSPLIGALTGFESVKAGHVFLLPCDAAFVSLEIAGLLLDLCANRNAVIPRWPDGKIEPLQAVYNARSAISAAKTALSEGKHDMLGMISHLQNIRYVSTLALQQYDPKLVTFFNINTVQDWIKAEHMLKRA